MSKTLLKNEFGFGLLQITIVLTIMAGLASYLIEPPSPTSLVKSNEKALLKADKALKSFVVLNGRLPCVDTDSDGVENCASSATKGTLPHITLGLRSHAFEEGDSTIAYGVYRKENGTAVKNGGIDREAGKVSIFSNDADLAVKKNRYQPTMAGGYTFDFTHANNLNGLDFCQGLKAAESQAYDASKLYVETSAGTKNNVAYAISMGGGIDSDGLSGLFDGLNGSSTSAFNSPGTLLSANYDDFVISRSFKDLKEVMQCQTTMLSMNMIANSVLIQKEVVDQAEDMKDAALEGAIMAGVNLAVIAYDTVLAGVDLANSFQTTGVASGLLSAAVASCAVLVGCAFIPIYTASVTSGNIAIGLSSVAMALSIAAGVSQAVATGLYVDVAIRAGASVPSSIGDGNGGSVSLTPDYTATINDLKAQLNNPQTLEGGGENGSDVTLPSVTVQATEARTDANNKRSSADASLVSANQRFTSLYSTADSMDDPNNGSTDLYNQSIAYKAAIVAEYAAFDTYNEKLTIKSQATTEVNTAQNLVDKYAASTTATTEQKNSAATALTDANAALTIASSDASAAEATFNQSKSTSDTAFNTAYAAAENHPVYFPQTTDGSGNVIPAHTVACKDVVGCSLPANFEAAAGHVVAFHNPASFGLSTYTVPDGTFLKAIQLEQLAVAAEDKANKAEAKKSQLENQIVKLQCMQDGKNWDDTNSVCNAAAPGSGSSAITLSTGAQNILDQADRQGVFK